jgi:DNA-binding transcriptional regulator YdaS (Cro superfamily)
MGKNPAHMKKLLSYINGLDKPQRATFCSAAGVSERYLRKAISKGQRMGVELCIGIEKASGADVRCEDLRPDVDWGYLRTASSTAAE